MPDSPPRARRTYGRARASEPSSDTGLFVFGNATSTDDSDTVGEAPAVDSLAQDGLVDKWTKRRDVWMDEMRGTRPATSSNAVSTTAAATATAGKGINVPAFPIEDDADDDDDDDEPTEEELKAMTLKLRREARGETELEHEHQSEPQHSRSRSPLAKAKPNSAARPLFGSSSLTSLPPSTPPKLPGTPPPLSSQLSTQGRVEIEIEEGGADTEGGDTEVEMEADESNGKDKDESMVSLPVRAPRRKARIIESDDDDEQQERGSDNPVVVDSADLDLDDSTSDADSDASMTPRASRIPRLSFEDTGRDRDPLRLFAGEDDEDEDEPVLPSKKLPKQLNKGDMEAMHRDIARAERVATARPETKRRPVSSWLTKANTVANAASQPSMRSSPVPLTSDDIQQFTPSSGPNHRRRRSTAGPVSSPTPGTSDMVRASRVPSHDDDEIKTELAELKLKDKSDPQKRLNAFKNSFIQKTTRGKDKVPELELDRDDDLSVIPDEPRGKLEFAPTMRKMGGARGVLSRSAALPAATRTRQQIMAFSGKGAKRDATETHVESAARHFGHAELKRANAGSRPAGQKKGRDEIITQRQVDNQMRAKHQEQVRQLTKSKEQAYGPGRELPEKRTLNIEALVSSSNDAADLVAESDEDSDFAPSGDEGEGEGEFEGSDEEPAGTGPSAIEGTLPSEDEAEAVKDSHDDDEGDKENQPDDDGDKENQPVPRSAPVDDEEDENENPFKVSMRRRRLVASDDEDDAPRDTSLRDAIKSQPAKPAKPSAPAASAGGFGGDDDFDMAGFGSAGGGFSQLFGATQAPAATDGFAALRNAADVDFCPTAALLPSVRISDTQKARDNALLAGQEDAGAPTPRPLNKKRYLNQDGFLTQTRPAGRETTQSEPTQGEGELPGSPEGLVKSSSTLLNSTHSDGPSHEDLDMPSPEGDGHYGRLRRRGSDDDDGYDGADATSPSPIKPKPKSKNAFDALQRGAAREARRADLAKHKPAFLDEQAEESDEDDGWGMNGGGGKDDEDDEDLDNGYVPELLDDAEVEEGEKSMQAALAAEKFRQVAQADDERLEAEAKKITEGQYRHKKRGTDFMSDDEDEDGQPRKWTKKQRRQRKLDKADGLYMLGNEENAFLQEYEVDLESDNEIDEDESQPASPEPARLSAREALDAVRLRTRMVATQSIETLLAVDEDGAGSQYAISARRTVVLHETETEAADEPAWNRSLPPLRRMPTATRSMESYSKYLSEESINPRRAAGAAGASASVVVAREQPRRPGVRRSDTSSTNESQGQSQNRGVTRQGSGILLDRNQRFAK